MLPLVILIFNSISGAIKSINPVIIDDGGYFFNSISGAIKRSGRIQGKDKEKTFSIP